MKSVAVYCGSSDKIPLPYLEAAGQMGNLIAKQGLKLVYGAGSTGMMGALARAALAEGGEVLGVIPELFDTPQLALKDIQQYLVVPDMHTRKARIAALSDGFIALPGGFGTFEEFFEILTWAQIGIHRKPIGLLNTEGYYNTLLQFFDEVRDKGFTYKEHHQLFIVEEAPATLLEKMRSYTPPAELNQWLER